MHKTELLVALRMTVNSKVVSAIDFFEVPQPALVMDYFDVKELFEHIKASGPMRMYECLDRCIGIVESLVNMQKYGIIHRDIKSANILRRRADGTPFIIILGLSSTLQSKVERKWTCATTSIDSSEKNTGVENGATFYGESPEQLCSNALSTHPSEQTKTIKGTMPWMAPEMITSLSWSDLPDA